MTFLILLGANYGMAKPSRGRLFGVYIPNERLNDDAITEVITQYRRNNRIWIIMSIITNFLMLIDTPYMSIVLLFLFIWLGFVIGGKLYIIGKASEQLKIIKRQRGWYDSVRDDEENYWKWALFYNNPNNPKMLVFNHMGSSNVNLGTKGGKIFMLFTIVILVLCCVMLPIALLMDDFIAPKVTITDDSITIKSTMEKATISFDTIETIYMTEDVRIGTKVVGSATPLYRRGIFYVSEFGNCEVSVFNENKSVIVIVPKKYIQSKENHKEVKPVIFNMKNLSETEEMFRKLVDNL